MSVIETTVFELIPDADEQGFVEADAVVQQRVAYQQPGLLRRTLARGDGRSWLVLTLWDSEEAADAGHAAGAAAPEVETMLAFVERVSIERRRFESLPG